MMSGSSDRYMDQRGTLNQGSLDNTASFRHCIYGILQIMSSAIYKRIKWNVALINCAHFNWTYQCRSIEHLNGQASDLNLVQIACKLTYIPYASNSVLKIRNQS